MREGDTRTQVATRRECEVCGELATWRHTFLLENCRSNPASSAYGRDDCSWCSDAEAFACDEHKDAVVRDSCPLGMGWCATFPYSNFKGMFLYWANKL